MLDVQAQTIEEAHIDVGDPNEREPGDQVASPALVKHLEAGDNEEESCDVVAEAVLAGEEVEELSRDESAATLATVFAPLARLTEDLFVSYSPGNACDREREDNEIGELA